MPIAPLFSPVYSTTRPYSQTKSNTQRPLMYLDEVLHMNNRECLVLLRGQNVLKLYKITPEEFPAFCRLKDVRVSSHTPRWRITEESERRHAPQPAQKPTPAADATPPQPPQAPPSPSATPSPPEAGIEREARREKRRPASEPQYSYGLMDSSLCGLEGDAEEDTGELAETAPYGALELMETMPEDIGGPPL
ncbi:type IV secretory system conjugative DNA transfer family protein [Flavonifractor plautii]|nr:type IV secretory system conjugative DNA transfer family protein [Flavonifractor plautii]MDB7881062.1 type IV secretory system conjugative DNA transfer family protein [Flavonifractor plautii]